MHNPVALLTERLRAAVAGALGPEFAGADPVVRRSAQPRFGDFQANAAMALAKQVGRPPREVAAAIVEHLDAGELCSAVEVAGPGFINLTLSADALARAAAGLLADDRLGVAPAERRRVVVDYSAPNVAKEMHVGHLRSTILGDALVRVLHFAGHDVVRQNHLGDWGTPFGMLIEHLVDIGEQEAVRELSVGDLTGFYKQARDKFDADPDFAGRARQRVVLLQGGDEASLRLWRLLFEASKVYFNTVYDRLGVLLTDDDIAPESFYNPRLAEVAAELEAKGLAVVDDGALCVFPPGFTNRDGQPLPLIIRYSTGGYGYATTDLAALRYRSLELQAGRILYVVGAPQATHLAMIFEVGRMAGWLGPDRPAEHVPFGSILGQDRKMYKTRSGDSVRLIDLLDEAVERAAAKVAEANPDLDAPTRERVASLVGIGAVKYADLASDRIKDYVFDWDRMLAFEGNTGPYLQYAHARIRSIFRRAEASGAGGRPPGEVVVSEPAERALVLQLLGLDEVVAAVAESLQPHRLCTYLFEVASAFTTFYEQCPVLRAPDAAVRGSRLALCELTARTLALGLGLLGIDAPDRM
ncbi:MAG: arginine--tRNA ligase [Actinobacteria bacterium]|nr:arginine--tRNA ligase [Actinomycetota bacterium]MBW3649107.1 arginine--tRNA ligase [Actinomycetota bacterium]